jgi:glycosyltransferase involved in cell wall biosynthesis
MSRINVLWVIDHVCYDGSLHGGGRLYWNVVPKFDPGRFHIIPCFLRASPVLRRVFTNSPAPVRILEKGKFDVTTIWTLLRLIRKERIHVMHLHCYGSSSFGRIAGWIAGVPTIVHDYDTEVYFPYPWYLWIFDRILAPKTSGAVAASPMVRDYAIKSRNIAPNKIRTMFHAVPQEKYLPAPREKIAAVRRQLGAGDGTKIVGAVTKLGPQRGNAYLLRAARQVLIQHPDALFLLIYKVTLYHRAPSKKYVASPDVTVGEESLEGLKTLARELDIEEKVRFIDSWDKSEQLISVMDIMVAPFLSKRFSSVKLLEGMAMGKPIIATGLGEQRQLIRDGINGYFVEPGDVSELATKISRILAHPRELDRLSCGAKEMSQQYSVDSYVQALQDWYTELAAHAFAKSSDRGSLE